MDALPVDPAEAGDLGYLQPSHQALQVIAGERQAHEFLERLRQQHADPDELALIVATLSGAALRGFGRVIVKALGMLQHG